MFFLFRGKILHTFDGGGGSRGGLKVRLLDEPKIEMGGGVNREGKRAGVSKYICMHVCI